MTLLIWIPSLQKHIRFRCLNGKQYRMILKNVDSHILNFIYLLNDIIKQNIVDSFDYLKFTIIDRFIIFAYLKIDFDTNILKLKKQCDKCTQEISLQLDLNFMLSYLQDKIDKNFETIFTFDNCIIGCDIPTIQREYSNLLYYADKNIDSNNFDIRSYQYFYEFITFINIKGACFYIQDYSFDEQKLIFEKIPIEYYNIIKSSYIEEIYKIFNSVIFFKFNCSCGETFELKLDSFNIAEVTKIFYKDFTNEDWLYSLLLLSSKGHMDGQTLNELNKSEINMLVNLFQQEDKMSQSSTEKDLFNPQTEFSHLTNNGQIDDFS